jgi:hypothetical protein
MNILKEFGVGFLLEERTTFAFCIIINFNNLYVKHDH